MGMFNRFEIGLAERAAKFAIKRGVTYDVKEKCFKGDPAQVLEAKLDLEEWVEKQKKKARFDDQYR